MTTSAYPPVLFCTVPNSGLFYLKNSPDFAMGACFMAGALEQEGFAVSYYDLDMALRKIRGGAFVLPMADQRVLSNLSDLHKHLYSIDEKLLIERWAQQLVDSIQPQEYGCIALSLDRRGYNTYQSRATLHFCAILSRLLKERFQCPVFIGGRQVVKQIGPGYLEKFFASIPAKTIDLFFKEDAHSSFPKFLKEFFGGMKLDSERAIGFAKEHSRFQHLARSLPKYDIVNAKDALIDWAKLFPETIVKKYPRLMELEPFYIAPYKFSLGCPFKCAFCTEGENDYYSEFDTDVLVNNLSRLNAKGVKNFRFYNNNINPSLKFFHSFVEKVKQANIKIQFSDSANLRIVSPEIFQNLAEIGCIKLWYGAETVSDRILAIINKRVGFEKVTNALNWANQAEIWNSVNFIYNFPHESADDFAQLSDFIQRRDIIDCCQLSEFRLMSDISYAKRPADFGIKVIGLSESKTVGAFDEIGGLTWEEKVKLGKVRSSALDAISPFWERLLTQNDYLIFGLRSLGFKKSEIKRMVYEIVESFPEKQEFLDYIFTLSWQIPDATHGIQLEHTISEMAFDPHSEDKALEFLPYVMAAPEKQLVQAGKL